VSPMPNSSRQNRGGSRKQSPRSGDTQLFATFGYGSNSVLQLRGRLDAPSLKGYPARVKGQRLAFAGPNMTWALDDETEACGTATIVPQKKAVALGTVVFLSEAQLNVLDWFEGVPYVYQRNEFVAEVLQDGVWRTTTAIAYVRQSTEWYPPSEAYCCAVMRNLRGSFPRLESLAICDTEGNEHKEWRHPGFSQLGLSALLFEIGVRQTETWQLPQDIWINMESVASGAGGFTAAHLHMAIQSGTSLPLWREELETAVRLLAAGNGVSELDHEPALDDSQAERYKEYI